MRISQIKTLCWTGNVLVLAGAGWVGTQFWETYQTVKVRGERAEVNWPEETAGPAIQKRWPGEITGFAEIWSTPVNGLVPKPPEPEDVGPRTRDPKGEFLAKYQFTTALMVVGDPEQSVAYVRVPGGKDDQTLRTGEELGGFTLIGFDRAPESGDPVLVFSHPEISELVRMPRAPQPRPPVFEHPPFEPVAHNDLAQPVVVRERIGRRAYQDLLADPSGLTWVVPEEEQLWWEEFGASDVFDKLVVNVAEDADGAPRGIRLMSQPGQGTAVGSGRGLNQGDTVISVNGFPIRGKEDLLRYLRGEGSGLRTYEVLVESESGAQRTLTYHLPRRRRAVSR